MSIDHLRKGGYVMTSPEPGTSKGASTASILGGMALVGAAAGYAAIAFRFRNGIGAATQAGGAFRKASPEFRAAEAFTREYVRQTERAESGAFTEGASAHQSKATEQQAARQRWQQQQHQQRQQEQNQRLNGRGLENSGAPAWALKTLGLNASEAPTREEAKRAFRERAKQVHPDSGGDDAAFQRLQQAWQAVKPHLSASRR